MASDQEQDEGKGRGFTVVDKRGQPSAEVHDAPEPAPEAPELPRIDFSTFVLSLGTSALMHMGLMADPETGERPAPALDQARQTIDAIEMLEEKTRGNLDSEEEKLLGSLLYELHMRFVEAGKSGG